MMSSRSTSVLKLQANVDSLDDAHHLAALHSWLLEDSTSLSDVSVESISQDHRGQMTGTFDIVIAAAGQATSLGSLVLAYLTWRKSARHEANSENSLKVYVEINGTKVNIEGLSDAKIQELVASLKQGLD
ncbi:effector-associated constant component EACC1 [Streptomyces sp. NPDC001118]